MHLNHILPKLISKSVFLPNNKLSTLPSIWSMAMLFIIALVGLTLSLIWLYYGIDWKTQLVERYAVVVSLEKKDKIYEESIRQRLAILLSNQDVAESYEILKPDEIRNQLQEALSELPEKYNYSLPIIVYIRGLKLDLDALQKEIKLIYKNSRIEDSGKWVDSIREIADFFYRIGLLVPWIIALLIIPVLYTNILLLVNSQFNCISHMVMLGAKESTIKFLLARYSLQWYILVMLLTSVLFSTGITILLFFQPFILPEYAKQEFLYNVTIIIGVTIPILAIISWSIGWWQTNRILKAN